MTYPESDFLDLVTLARKFDTCKEEIRKAILNFIERGYKIEIIEWGAQKKWKVNYHQFRAALMHERTFNPRPTDHD